jgi:hypothetical protein
MRPLATASNEMPIALTDDQLTMVMRAAAPLSPRDRGPFLEGVATALAGRREIGDGDVFRAIKEQQRRFFDPPLRA